VKQAGCDRLAFAQRAISAVISLISRGLVSIERRVWVMRIVVPSVIKDMGTKRHSATPFHRIAFRPYPRYLRQGETR
jgi:hypothetical protein